MYLNEVLVGVCGFTVGQVTVNAALDMVFLWA